MIRALLLLVVATMASACITTKQAPICLKTCLPQNLADSTLFLRPDPIATLPNGTKTRFSELVQPLGDSTAYTIVVWASWCPPDTLPQDNTPLIMLSIDQCADAWRIATSQLPPTTATHAQIDPYAAEKFLQALGIYGIPHTVRFEP